MTLALCFLLVSPPRLALAGDNVEKALKLSSVSLFGGDGSKISSSLQLLEGVNLCKDLVNAPANVVTPKSLAELAADIASEHGLACEILERDAIEARGMGAYLGVAQGSKPGEGDPRFIHLTYTPEVPPPQSYRASRVLV